MYKYDLFHLQFIIPFEPLRFSVILRWPLQDAILFLRSHRQRNHGMLLFELFDCVQREEIFGSFRYGISIFWWVGWETFMNVAFGWINVKDVANAHILANGHALDNGRYCLVERVIHFSKLKLMETNMGMLLYGRIISYLEFLSMKRDFLVRLCWRHAP
ncbi:uncharacterized protein LOC131647909 isoform X2 [Vicia villosa]|uniref:uncharacterized protein LOC131647909 isoform X2 n=1 Tax=Vicia villosa TaxID=3911 RepID=UPI00273AC83A|nr:uncharacterized protein LOC131647909 isoform X2 [Vicia villosa]